MKKYFYSLAFILMGILVLTACNTDTDKSDKSAHSDVGGSIKPRNDTQIIESSYPPMVMINDHLYKDTGYINSALKCGTADGEIITSVESLKKPQKNDESNFGTGYEYQFWTEGYVNVKINDRWTLFQKLSTKNTDMPKWVANFNAEVMEVKEDRLLVKITDIPEDFKWIFKSKGIEKIKPVSLTIENLRKTDDGKEIKIKDLKGKTVQVWYDGSIKYAEPEMSNPMELGKIYRITPIEK
ncbi:MAG: hypothetical protein Q4A42_02190 [Tissierellia bacterium]|nr:hypothetical protein [Tissierellia bacterium]